MLTDTIFQPLTEKHLPTNQKLINLCYSDVKNLTSILSCCLVDLSYNLDDIAPAENVTQALYLVI